MLYAFYSQCNNDQVYKYTCRMKAVLSLNDNMTLDIDFRHALSSGLATHALCLSTILVYNPFGMWLYHHTLIFAYVIFTQANDMFLPQQWLVYVPWNPHYSSLLFSLHPHHLVSMSANFILGIYILCDQHTSPRLSSCRCVHTYMYICGLMWYVVWNIYFELSGVYILWNAIRKRIE